MLKIFFAFPAFVLLMNSDLLVSVLLDRRKSATYQTFSVNDLEGPGLEGSGSCWGGWLFISLLGKAPSPGRRPSGSWFFRLGGDLVRFVLQRLPLNTGLFFFLVPAQIRPIQEGVKLSLGEDQTIFSVHHTSMIFGVEKGQQLQ